MSPKELLYIDDALGHEQFLIAQCQEAEAALSDPKLKQRVRQLQSAHQQIFQPPDGARLRRDGHE